MVNITGKIMENVIELWILTDLPILWYTFLKKLEFEAKFEKELLEEHADAHELVISFFNAALI